MMKLQNRLVNITIICLLLFHCFVAVYVQVNWDEFFRLSRIHEWKNGDLKALFESGYIYPFLWLPYVSENEVHQIIAARLVMLVLFAYSLFLLFKIFAEFVSVQAAKIAIIFYMGFSYVVMNATSFRVDPIILALLLTSIYILICRFSLVGAILAGICIGFAGFVSLKSAFLIPTISIILLWQVWRSDNRIRTFGTSIISGCVALFVFGVSVWAHQQGLNQHEQAGEFIQYAAGGTMIKYGLFPTRNTFLLSVSINILFYALMAWGIFKLKDFRAHPKKTGQFFLVLGMCLPIFSLVFYAHAYDYYYTYMMATVSLLIAIAAEHLLRTKSLLIPFLPVAVLIVAGLSMVKVYKYPNTPQYEVLDVVHEVFPEPVPYIDYCSMVSSYSKHGIFMSSIQMFEYYERGRPVFPDIIKTQQPPLLLANLPVLDLARVQNKQVQEPFLTEDAELLRQHYIAHWGPIYVAGKTFSAEETKISSEVLISGLYTIETNGDVRVNGKSYRDGETVLLDPEVVAINKASGVTLTLRWGDHLKKPDQAPPKGLLFNGI